MHDCPKCFSTDTYQVNDNSTDLYLKHGEVFWFEVTQIRFCNDCGIEYEHKLDRDCYRCENAAEAAEMARYEL